MGALLSSRTTVNTAAQRRTGDGNGSVVSLPSCPSCSNRAAASQLVSTRGRQGCRAGGAMLGVPGVVMTGPVVWGPGKVPTPALQAMRQGPEALHALQAGTAAMQQVVPMAVKLKYP
jgi:hypothetical protein